MTREEGFGRWTVRLLALVGALTSIINETVHQLRARDLVTEAQLNELRRLPRISEARARALLGPLADSMPAPRDLKTLADPCPPKASGASSTTTTSTSTTTKPTKRTKKSTVASCDG